MKLSRCKYFFVMFIVTLFVAVPTFAFAGGKVTICHIPPGNPTNPQTISINENALAEHLAHGDQLGECPCPDTACPAEVKVVNDESEPVPITGEVSGSVSIEGIPNVKIIDGKIPFQATLQCTPPSCGDAVIYSVPSGQMCVVENFSCITHFSGAPTEGTALICQIWTMVNGVGAQHSLPRSDALTTYGYLSTGAMVKIYATSGDILVDGYLTAGGGATFPDLWVSISGYCIDVDAP